MLKKRSSLAIARAVTFALILREVRGRFGKNRLGAFWFVCEPLAHIVLLLILFVAVRQRMVPGTEYAVFLLQGVVPFILLRNIALKGMEAVNANKGLFAYRQVKPFDMVLARAATETLLMACVYIIIVFVLGWFFGYDVMIHRPLQWLAALCTGLVFSFALALVYCVLIKQFPDLATLIRMLFFPLYLISGVIVPLHMIPVKYMHYLLWNPYLHIIEMLRFDSLAHYPKLAQAGLAWPAWCAALTLLLGLLLYRQKRHQLVAA